MQSPPLQSAITPAAIGTESAHGGDKFQTGLRRRVSDVIAAFRPLIESDGGKIEFVDITDRRIVLIRMKGACAGCPQSFMTMQMGIERALLEQIPELRGVELA